MALITEPTREALACCAGWLDGHARLMLADESAKRAIFHLLFEFCCADHAKIDLDKLYFIERDAFTREGLRPPTVAEFFGMGRIKDDRSSPDRQSISTVY